MPKLRIIFLGGKLLALCFEFDERFRAILENIPSSVIVIEEPDGKVTYANNRALTSWCKPCWIEINKHTATMKILTLESKICLPKNFTVAAFFKEEILRNSIIVIEQHSGKRFIVVVSGNPLIVKKAKSMLQVVLDDVTAHIMLKTH